MKKSWGDVGVKPIPNARHLGQRANSDLLREAANTTSDSHITPYTVYRRVMGDHAKDVVSINPLKSNDSGTWYKVTDGERSFQVYQPRNGPARLVKALSTYTPSPNEAWTSLRHAGYQFKPKDGKAMIDGCKVEIRGDTVRLSGKNVQKVLQTILHGIADKRSSEDYMSPQQSLTAMEVRPW